MGVVGVLDRFQRRHRWAGLPIAVLWKFLDDEGTYLAALITYYGFLSLFPLLLLALTVLGFVLQDDPALQQALVNSALRNFPVIGDQIGENIGSLQGSVPALVVSVVVSVYGGLGVMVAVQNAFARMWAVPKAERPALPTAYARGALAVAVLAAAIVVATGLAALGALLPGLPTPLAGVGQVVLTVAGVAVNATLVVLAFKLLTPRPLTWRQVVPGAVLAAVAWQLLQSIGAYLVRYQLQGTSASYGVFGIVLGLLAWIYLSVVVALFCTEINTVRTLRLYPRSLLSAMPDDTATTPADERAYTVYAEAERLKSFQNIEVGFETPVPHPRAADEDGAPDRAAPPS
ncbi:YihY/virulence factor BrkB family protein [Actinomycetospora termitidis]|uniref:YhjD/YihY/BrkB family envelope integrity protein n=1 Tax=Actinomycetospora termitidis TaxID=3053470 RepID=A0ABT7M1B3_9PSEU|nr:YhjD/YihY/BrkB family envelope integrity protein [Actinomycetospora sp. Odt1-22]MDL5154446.1 YhjD/YihY/BrkB family envelope integrity protein [Actinomycetospora sp. Odt1-22]